MNKGKWLGRYSLHGARGCVSEEFIGILGWGSPKDDTRNTVKVETFKLWFSGDECLRPWQAMLFQS